MQQMITAQPRGYSRPVSLVLPKMPAANYRTFQISSPIPTHFRKASCREVECQHYGRGWQTTVDTNTELGARQANYIRLHSGRHFTYTENGGVVTFLFPPGQQCFTTHQVPLGRPEIYVVRGGDWRGNPRGEHRRHVRAADWVDQFANHQDRLATRFNQG